MRILIWGLVYSLLSILAGIIGPFFSFDGGIYGNMINVFWGFIYGIGWYIAGIVFGFASFTASLFGSAIWPIFIFLVVGYAFSKLLSVEFRQKRLAIIIAVISLFAVLPSHLIVRTPLEYVPTYYSILSALY